MPAGMASPQARQGQRRGRPAPKAQTVQYRKFKGVNRTDARVAIDDDEFSWLENAVTIGNGAIQILPKQGASVATIAAGVSTLWGVVLKGSPVMISINTDGSMSQITPGGVVTAIAPAATVTTSAVVTIWRDNPVLILDPTKGYMKWDGTTFTVIDALKLGVSLAVFAGRVWIANGRTITFTSPNTFDNFTPVDGSSSTIITDEAFPGNIIELASALEQLWIIGSAAINAIANVQATGTSPNVVTTFSNTNVVTYVGTTAPHSVVGYFRSLALLSPFGAYALAGVTPQKLSDKLDGLFDELTLSATETMTAVAVVQKLLCLLIRVKYNGTDAAAGSGGIPLVLGYTQGKWFFASQGALTWITTLNVNGVAQAWGTDGSHIYQLFGAASTVAVKYKVQSKLYDFGLATTAKAAMKVGLEIQAPTLVAPTMTIDSEFLSQNIPVSAGNAIIIINALGAPLTILNALNNPLTIITQGIIMSRQNADMFGRYLGWTLTGEDPPYRIQAVQLEVAPTREWSTP